MSYNRQAPLELHELCLKIHVESMSNPNTAGAGNATVRRKRNKMVDLSQFLGCCNTMHLITMAPVGLLD